MRFFLVIWFSTTIIGVVPFFLARVMLLVTSIICLRSVHFSRCDLVLYMLPIDVCNTRTM